MLTRLLQTAKTDPAIVALLGVVAGAILTRLLPAIYTGILWLARWAGRRIGGRFAFWSFQKTYLDWVVTEQSELRLTGIVSADEAKKPKLEQVFVSLHVASKSPSEGTDWSSVAPTFIRTWDDVLDMLEVCQSLTDRERLDSSKLRILWHEARRAAGRATLREHLLRFFNRRRVDSESTKAAEWVQGKLSSLEEFLPDYLLHRILKERSRVAILGAPGAGKSTLLQYLALSFARERSGDPKLKRRGILRRRLGHQRWRVPLFLRLSTVATALAKGTADGDTTLLDAVKSVLPPDLQRDPAASNYFLRAMRRGRCIVLLDGLDEVPSDAEFHVVVRAIKSAIIQYPRNHFIITSRVAGWRGGVGSEFDVYYVNDLTERQISDFIDIWYSSVERNAVAGRLEDEGEAARHARERRATQRAAELKGTLRDNPGIRRLAANPMLLSIIALVHRSLATLPRERTKLYDQCSKILLEQWDVYRGVRVDDTNLKLQQKEKLMERLAFALHAGEFGAGAGSREASATDIASLLSNVLPSIGKPADDAPHLLQMLTERSGILIERQRGVLSFAHLTFQEYFAAKYLAASKDGSSNAYLLHEHRILDDWWREVTLLYAGMLPDTSEFVRGVYEPADDLCKRRLRVAALCLGEAVAVEDLQLREGILAALLYVRTLTATRHALPGEVADYLLGWCKSDAWFNAAAVATALSDGSHDLERLIGDAIADSNATLRVAALSALARLQHTTLLKRFTEAAFHSLRTGERDERHAAAAALRNIVSKTASSETRYRLQDILGNASQDLASLAADVLALVHRPLEGMPESIWERIGDLPTEAARALLARHISDTEDPNQLQGVRAALVGLVDSWRHRLNEVVWTTTPPSLASKNADIYNDMLAEVLVEQRGNTALTVADAMLHTAKSHKDARIEDLARPLLVADDPGARRTALRLIRSRPYSRYTKATVDHVVDALDDRDSTVRIEALHALSELRSGGRARLARKLVTIASDPDLSVRRTALRLLGKVAHTDSRQQAIAVCERSLSNRDARLAIAAAASLAELTGQREVSRIETELRGASLIGVKPSRLLKWRVPLRHFDVQLIADLSDVVVNAKSELLFHTLLEYVKVFAPGPRLYFGLPEGASLDPSWSKRLWETVSGVWIRDTGHADWDVMLQATARAYRAVPSQVAESELLGCLRAADHDVRVFGADLLRAVSSFAAPSPEIVDALAACMNLTYSSLRLRATGAAGALIKNAAYAEALKPTLLRLLSDDSLPVREAAWQTLVLPESRLII